MCVVSFLVRGFPGFVVHSSLRFVGDFGLKSLGSGSHTAQGVLKGMALAPRVHLLFLVSHFLRLVSRPQILDCDLRAHM